MDQDSLRRFRKYYADRRSDGTPGALNALAVKETVLLPCSTQRDVQRYRAMVYQAGTRLGKIFSAGIQYDLIDGKTIEGLLVTRIDGGLVEVDAETGEPTGHVE